LAAVVATGACSGGDSDTLRPIPIQGGTAPAPTPAVATTSTTTIAATTTTVLGTVPGSVAGQAAGDWDGAKYDAGTISARTKVGNLEAISFDRWSYTAPDGTRSDAPNLAAEPAVGWWQTSPFANVQVRNRTFVLAPDVEVLVLDEAGRAAACTTPPPASPAVAWKPGDPSALGAQPDDIAVLTYSTTGQVTRIRLTHGC
jgi:hypothetical protein